MRKLLGLFLAFDWNAVRKSEAINRIFRLIRANSWDFLPLHILWAFLSAACIWNEGNDNCRGKYIIHWVFFGLCVIEFIYKVNCNTNRILSRTNDYFWIWWFCEFSEKFVWGNFFETFLYSSRHWIFDWFIFKYFTLKNLDNDRLTRD